MSFLAIFTFDLTNTSSSDNIAYNTIDNHLIDLGLLKYLVSNNNINSNLPNNTYAGVFRGASARKVCDDLFTSIEIIFNQKQISANVFLAVGGDSWAWRTRRYQFNTH